MKKSLKSHFPIIRSKEEVRLIIRKNLRLEELFQSWTAGQQEEFWIFVPETGVSKSCMIHFSKKS